jgi:membrane protein
MAKMILRSLKAAADLVIETYLGWISNNAPLHAAALAFYALISMAPLLTMAVIVVGHSQETVLMNFVVMQMERMGGKVAGDLVEDILNSRHMPSNTPALIISIIFLVFGASAVILELQNSINSMWSLTAKKCDVTRSVLLFIRQRIISAAVVMVFGYILLAVLIINTLWSTFYTKFVQSTLLSLGMALLPESLWGSLIIYTLIFAAIFKFMPSASIRWRDVWLGSVLTALLFSLGNYLIQLYFIHIFFASAYGAASSIVIFLLWVNYSAMIVLFGAKFTQVYARKYGQPIEPYENIALEKLQET